MKTIIILALCAFIAFNAYESAQTSVNAIRAHNTTLSESFNANDSKNELSY